MSEGVNETAVSFVNSSTATTSSDTTSTTDALGTTLERSNETPPDSPTSSATALPSGKATRKATYVVRKYRKYATNGRAFHLIDGKKIRSALTHKKWPPRNRRVSFPSDDKELVTGYLEPANPWEHAKNVNIEDLISSYKASCQRHGAEPMENLLAQLEKLDISDDERCPELSLKNECLDAPHCEPLEELLKRVQFEKIDVESSSLDDESATILFDMLEYYQSARHLNMSNNRDIGSRGWQACAQMIKKTTCLEQLEARDITLTQQHMNILKRPLQLVSHLHVLKLQHCGLAGPAFVILVAALKMNTGIKELYLADNGFEQEDAIQLGALLRVNNHLQLLDISNNHIKDEGVRDLLDGLIAQSGESRSGKGLSILVLWNNDLTRTSSPYFSEAIAQCQSLETLNIGKNSVGNELLEMAQEPLTKSRNLLQLGMQSTHITCKGALILAGIIEKNRSLQRIDLRDNNIQMEGLAALSFAMKRNPFVTQLDLDSSPWSNKPATIEQYLDLVGEIRKHCARNEEPTSTDESTSESGSPQHRSRLSSVSSRKISLTCQTLPRSPPSVAPNTINDIATRSMLEPKRTSGGRLRSPAPSPIPSPVASPIPSPSRGRFVVSRVCENSLSSTNSSASSSPVTPSSLESSPTRFFPPSPGVTSSRFRVTVVEAIEPSPITSKTVVTAASANVTIGFNYKIQAPEESADADDSDSVFRSDVEVVRRVDANDSSSSIDTSTENEFKSVRVDANDREGEAGASETKKEKERVENLVARDVVETDRNKVPAKIEDNQRVDATRDKLREGVEASEDSTDSTNALTGDNGAISTSPKEITRISGNPSTEPPETKVNATRRVDASVRDEIMSCYEPRNKKPEQPQRQATSLEKLLGLFQHPGSFFSAGSYAEKTEIRNPIQDRVNSMIALGDKFQQYLREGRSTVKSTSEDSPSHPILQRSVSDATRSAVKADPVKSLSIPQLSSIQTTFARDCRDETSKPRETSAREEPRRDAGSGTLGEEPVLQEEKVSRISEDATLPERAPDDERTRELRSWEEIERSASPDQRDNVICQPKLKDIPEYSILETRDDACPGTLDNSSRPESSGLEIEDDARLKCDSSSSTTDSINDHSCKDSSRFKVKCDITSGVKSVHTLRGAGDVHNFFTSRFDDWRARTISVETRDDDENSTITTEIYEDGRNVENDSSRPRDDCEKSLTNERGTDTARAQLDPSLTNFHDACMNFLNEPKILEALELTAESLGVERILADTEVRRDESIETFLPFARSSIETGGTFVDEPASDDTSDSYYAHFANEVESTVIENHLGQMNRGETLEAKVTPEARSIEAHSEERNNTELLIRVPSTAVLTNEFALTRIAIAPIDDEDYVPASLDQISSSLSEDSGYSGKLSVDDTRNGDTSLNDLVEISPIAETPTIVEKQRESYDESFDDKSLKIEEGDAYARTNVGPDLVSFLGVETPETRVDSCDAISSESSEDLIFRMTDIDGKDTTRAIVTKMDACAIDRYCETGRSSSGNLFIETSRNAHRNSQDSGIEEVTVSISEDTNSLEASNQRSDNFQESLDSGIDSECSSVCARVDVGTDAQKERARDPGKFDKSLLYGETASFASRPIGIEEMLGTIGDTVGLARIDDGKSVDTKISDVLGSLGEGT